MPVDCARWQAVLAVVHNVNDATPGQGVMHNVNDENIELDMTGASCDVCDREVQCVLLTSSYGDVETYVCRECLSKAISLVRETLKAVTARPS